MSRLFRIGVFRLAVVLTVILLAYAVALPGGHDEPIDSARVWAAAGNDAAEESAPKRPTRAMENKTARTDLVAARMETSDRHDEHASIGHGDCGVSCNSVVVIAMLSIDHSDAMWLWGPPQEATTDADPNRLYSPPRTS